MIDNRIWPRRGEDPERHGDHHRDEQSEQRELGRGGKTRPDLVTDRLPRGERIAEIPVREVTDIAHELQIERLVEAERSPNLLDRLLGRGGAGEISRRITGQRSCQQEGDNDHADQARHRDQQALADHAQHQRSPPLRRATPSNLRRLRKFVRAAGRLCTPTLTLPRRRERGRRQRRGWPGH